MKYVLSKLKERAHFLSFEYYVTDILYYFSNGKTLQKRFYDAVNEGNEETPNGDEIVMDIMKRAGLKFEGE